MAFDDSETTDNSSSGRDFNVSRNWSMSVAFSRHRSASSSDTICQLITGNWCTM